MSSWQRQIIPALAFAHALAIVSFQTCILLMVVSLEAKRLDQQIDVFSIVFFSS